MAAGMEVLFSTVQSRLSGAGDSLVCCLHWNMVANGFKCIGRGENDLAPEEAVKLSELLPDGWNQSQNDYALLYRKQNSTDTHVLKVIRIEGQLLVHVMRLKDETVANITLDISDYTTDDLSSYDSAFKNLGDLEKKFKKEIIDELDKKGKKETRLQDTRSRPRPQPDRSAPDYDPLRVGPVRGRPPPEWQEPSNPFAVGRGDLDPLAGGIGGGMLMDPFRGGMGGPLRGDPNAGLPGRLPPGAVPPGARFDPFGPPGPGPGPMGPGAGYRTGPDPDHERPPDYDDMFM